LAEPDLLIFDLDGTLVDSAPDLQRAVNRVLADRGCPPIPLADLRSMIGDGAAQLLKRAFEARGIAMQDPAATLREFIAHYRADPTANTLMYDGVFDTLTALHSRGRALAVCTNKPENPTHEILRRFGIAGYFTRVVCGDTHEFRKPDPRMLTGLLADFGVSAPRAVMIGDSEVDAATARAAAVPFVLMTYGYRRGAVHDIACMAALDSFADLAGQLSV
jgi:phosphoglycolate phosphatase